jgi:integrase
VSGIANWRLSHLPKSLPPEQVERMLASCDRGRPVGERDYAILLLLARLGLRAGEPGFIVKKLKFPVGLEESRR